MTVSKKLNIIGIIKINIMNITHKTYHVHLNTIKVTTFPLISLIASPQSHYKHKTNTTQ